jgi:hypothetical protein
MYPDAWPSTFSPVQGHPCQRDYLRMEAHRFHFNHLNISAQKSRLLGGALLNPLFFFAPVDPFNHQHCRACRTVQPGNALQHANSLHSTVRRRLLVVRRATPNSSGLPLLVRSISAMRCLLQPWALPGSCGTAVTPEALEPPCFNGIALNCHSRPCSSDL